MQDRESESERSRVIQGRTQGGGRRGVGRKTKRERVGERPEVKAVSSGHP